VSNTPITLEWPLPINDILSIHPKFVGMVLTGELLIKQCFSHTGPHVAEAGYPVDGVNGQAKTIRLIQDREFQGGADIAFLFVTTYMNMMLSGSPIS
jgi:hypothetical protein